MQTNRDGQIVAWLGGIGAAGGPHVSQRFGIDLGRTYCRLKALVNDGLLEHHAVLHRRPGVYLATARGLRWQGLSRLSVFRVRPGSFEHVWQIAGTASALHGGLEGWQVLGEREFRALEADEQKLIASTQIDSSRPRAMLHRPDLALISPRGDVAVVEVELSAKTPALLQKICRGWARTRHVEHVYYLAAPRAHRAVCRAVASTRTSDLITVLDLDDLAGLAERELAREREPRPESPIEPAPAREPQSQDLWQFPEDDTFQRAGEEAKDVLGA